MGDKIDSATKENVSSAIEKLKAAISGDNLDEIKRLTEELTQASHKLAEIMYANAAQDQSQGGGPQPDSQEGASKDDDVVDADFEEVKK